MLAREIVEYASPTLARLKLGSLMNLAADEALFGDFASVRAQLGEKGVAMTILRLRGGRALVYVYRPCDLERTLADEAVRQFLSGCGYARFGAEDAVRKLRRRLNTSEAFPHEIGVFLGYPLADVLGFIANGGRNCLACGCWKVYSDPGCALRLFRRFEKCRTVYQRLFASGCPLSKLTVAVRPA